MGLYLLYLQSFPLANLDGFIFSLFLKMSIVACRMSQHSVQPWLGLSKNTL